MACSLASTIHPLPFGPELNICAEVGIKYPVAMTIAAFAKTVSELDTPLPPCQDISGRLWDVLTMFRLAAKHGRLGDWLSRDRNQLGVRGRRADQPNEAGDRDSESNLWAG